MGRIGRWASTVTALALLAGCSSGSDQAGPTTSTSAKTGTPAAANPSSSTGLEPAAVDVPCPGPDPEIASEDTGDGRVLSADLDDDGAGDRAVLTAPEDDSKSTGWMVSAKLSSRGFVSGPIVDHGGPAPPRLLGSHELNGSPPAELVVMVGTGAARHIVALYGESECELLPLRRFDQAALFAVGGSVGAVSGLRCEPDGTLRLFEGTSADGERYDVTITDLTVVGLDISETSSRLETVPTTDDGFGELSSLACGDALL